MMFSMRITKLLYAVPMEYLDLVNLGNRQLRFMSLATLYSTITSNL